jgi:hypothetical protein
MRRQRDEHGNAPRGPQALRIRGLLLKNLGKIMPVRVARRACFKAMRHNSPGLRKLAFRTASFDPGK